MVMPGEESHGIQTRFRGLYKMKKVSSGHLRFLVNHRHEWIGFRILNALCSFSCFLSADSFQM
jgi:hypothetical protein